MWCRLPPGQARLKRLCSRPSLPRVNANPPLLSQERAWAPLSSFCQETPTQKGRSLGQTKRGVVLQLHVQQTEVTGWLQTDPSAPLAPLSPHLTPAFTKVSGGQPLTDITQSWHPSPQKGPISPLPYAHTVPDCPSSSNLPLVPPAPRLSSDQWQSQPSTEKALWSS